MGNRSHLVQAAAPGQLLSAVVFAFCLIASCEGVSRHPLTRATDGMGGATANGSATTSIGSGGGAGALPSEHGPASGGREGEPPPGGEGGGLYFPDPEAGGGAAGQGVTGGGGNEGDGVVGEGGSAGESVISEGGSAGDDPTGGGNAGEDGGAGGGGRIFTRCSSKAPFGIPERVLGLPDGAVRLRLNPSETVGYYARFPITSSYADLEVTKRASRSDAFSTGISLNTNDSGWDFTPTLPSDGSIIYFESRANDLTWRIHQSVWDPGQQAFGSVDLVAGLGAGGNHGADGAPYILPSGEVLYFHSDRFGMGIMRAERIGTSFARVKTVPITFPQGLIFTASCPVVSPDELTIYFTAQDSAGRTDVWTATRTNATGPFGEAAPVLEVNRATTNEVPSFISEDGCRLYFDRNSNVPFHWTPPGNSFVAEREPDSE